MRKASLCTNELFRATHNTVTALNASIHRASLPRMKARTEPSWKTEARCVGLSTCRIYPTVSFRKHSASWSTFLLHLVICRQELNADNYFILFSGIDDKNRTKQALPLFFGAASRPWHCGSNLYRRRRPRRRCSAGVQDFPQVIIALRHLT